MLGSMMIGGITIIFSIASLLQNKRIRCLIVTNSILMIAIAFYYNSINDSEINASFLVFQDIKESSNLTKKPIVDLFIMGDVLQL